MALDFKEIDVSAIAEKLNTFWSSNLFQDKHITDQLWRGYLYTMENFYAQLYQLAKARGINTIPPDWMSHWERFEFNNENRVDAWNPLYPYAYYLPRNVRSVYVLRESPREITILPRGTIIDSDNKLILPDGTERKEGDSVYIESDYQDYNVTCPTCGGFGVYLGNPCPTCGGSGSVSGAYAPSGMPVDTVIYLKRDDTINDLDETTVPLGDFICGDGTIGCNRLPDADQNYIAFKEEPYEVLYSQYVVRNTEIIYEMFGSLIGYYKKDSQEYLKEVQALWYAYWNGSTFNNIDVGLSVLSQLPVTSNPGYVTDFEEHLTEKLISFEVTTDFLADPICELISTPTEMSPGVYALKVECPRLSSYVFTQGLDYTVTVDYESSFTGDVPNIDPAPKVMFNTSTSPVASLLAVGDVLNITYEDGTGQYVITIGGIDYFVDNGTVPDVYENQFIPEFSPLTDDIQVYDYINFPDWWTSFFSGINIFDSSLGTARLKFDTPHLLDGNETTFDSWANGALARATLWPYETFLVVLSEKAMPTSQEKMDMLKTFLDLIKPTYTTYLIVGNWTFEDSAKARDVGFFGSETQFVPRDHGNRFHRHDGWHYPNLDTGERTFDSYYGIEYLALTNIYPEYTLYDETNPPARFDELRERTFDSGILLDRHSEIDSLELIQV